MNPLGINKYLAIGTAGMAVIAGILFCLWRYEVKDHAATKALLVTAQTVITKYEDNVQKSERLNNAYQADINHLNASIKRLRSKPARCVTIVSQTGLHHEPGQGRGHDGKNGQGLGISSEWLNEYAIEAEKHRIDKNACIDFVNENWGKP